MSLHALVRSRRPQLRAAVSAVLAGAVLAAPAARADAAPATYVPWSPYLPGWTEEYVPSSANDCVAGRAACVKHSVKELDRVLQETGQRCSHQAVFALAYTRMTQTYAWTSTDPGYYEDVAFANHQGAVFVKHYLDAWTSWRAGDRAAVPRAWQIAFDAAAAKSVTGGGDLLLGMNAHINRDLPYVIASVGLVAPDGTSRKADFDKVEQWLAAASEPLVEEASQRFDPTMDDSSDPYGLSASALMQVVSAWRENAWRNAEALVTAPTPAARALVEARIEATAEAIAQSLLAANAYGPLRSSAQRDSWCAVHHGDRAPLPYPFGTPAPYGP